MLRKIRRNITRYAAVSLYKQMILPLFDYSGFLLMSCNLGQKRELKRIQNTVYSGYSGHIYSGHLDIVATFPGTKSNYSIIFRSDIVATRI